MSIARRRPLEAARAAVPDAPLVAMDVGQTSTKVLIRDVLGPERRFRLGGVQTDRPLVPQLRILIAHALGDVGENAVVTLGVTGLTPRDADAAVLLELPGGLAAREVRLAHDSVTSALGALGDSRGAVVAAGTGTVALGVGRGRVARVDGWGNIMGDAGSAYWIGRAALDAAMRAHDGRGPQSAFTDVAAAYWPDLEGAYVQLQNDPERVSTVASFAAEVSRLAEMDAVCAEICAQAGRELAHTAGTALRRVEEPQGDDPTQVAAIGGVFASPAVLRAFQDRLVDVAPRARLISPEVDGVDGSALMAGLSEAHPLRALISVARRQEDQE
ncbi:N-acetylglucosamine kinase [Nesterenkonia sp. K-15-9-6]|uniref:N-acetylglucosamine kinase n=1 Tax=Nesterenkonia sp. K-15-9-6 TaxID=3093918 RepID=UPI0040444A1B